MARILHARPTTIPHQTAAHAHSGAARGISTKNLRTCAAVSSSAQLRSTGCHSEVWPMCTTSDMNEKLLCSTTNAASGTAYRGGQKGSAPGQ